MIMITISQAELTDNGYLYIVSQDSHNVILRNTDGRNEHFAIRESFSGWCLDAEDGRFLEFCSSRE